MTDDRARFDRWLWFTRFYKSRSLATDAVSAGHARLNGERVKPSHAVRVGDSLSILRGTISFDCVVQAIPERRGPATEAAHCYEETAASVARRAEFAAQMKIGAALAPSPDHRPDKRDRRALRQARGRG